MSDSGGGRDKGRDEGDKWDEGRPSVGDRDTDSVRLGYVDSRSLNEIHRLGETRVCG